MQLQQSYRSVRAEAGTVLKKNVSEDNVSNPRPMILSNEAAQAWEREQQQHKKHLEINMTDEERKHLLGKDNPEGSENVPSAVPVVPVLPIDRFIDTTQANNLRPEVFKALSQFACDEINGLLPNKTLQAIALQQELPSGFKDFFARFGITWTTQQRQRNFEMEIRNKLDSSLLYQTLCAQSQLNQALTRKLRVEQNKPQKITKEMEMAKSELLQANENIKNLQQENAKSATALKEAVKARDLAEKQLKELNDRLINMTKEHSELERKFAAFEQQHIKVINDSRVAEVKLSNRLREMDGKLSEAATVSQTLSELTKRFTELEAKLEKVNGKNLELTNQVTRLQTENAMLKDTQDFVYAADK
jgi:hypothetical protein